MILGAFCMQARIAHAKTKLLIDAGLYTPQEA